MSPGAGLTAAETAEHLRPHGRDHETIPLNEEAYWGKPIDDEHYVLISPPTDPTHH